jgi:glycosyltransferase involved in cell wall biosynthesis
MRVLMANKYLYARAGAETYMLTVAAELQARGHAVGFFGMAHPENTTLGPCGTIPALEFGVRQGKLAALGNLARASFAAAAGATPRRLRAFVRDFKPDLIHAHNIYNQMSPALFVEHARRIPVVMTVHDYKPVCPNYSLFTQGETCTRCLSGRFGACVTHRCVQNSTFKSAIAAASSWMHKTRRSYTRGYHRLIAPSAFLSARLAEGGLPAERIDVLNNFAAPAPEFTPPGTGILYFGRLCREKGVHTLLEAYAGLRAPRPELRIAGEGPLAEELKAFARERGLTTVTWLGRIPPAAVARELERCAFSVVPSEWFENCSMAILESLAHGRAVIASDKGGNPELIRPGLDGDIFPSGDVAALRACMQPLADEPARCVQMGRRAREAALARFCPAVHLDALLKIYETARAQVASAGNGQALAPNAVRHAGATL